MIYKLSQYDLMLASPPEPMDEMSYIQIQEMRADAEWQMQELLEQCEKEREEK